MQLLFFNSHYQNTRLSTLTHNSGISFLWLLALVLLPLGSSAQTAKFTIQFAACPTETEADALVQELKAKGVDARIYPLSVADNKQTFRVRSGSFASVKAARQIAERWVDGGVINSYWVAREDAAQEPRLITAGATAPVEKISKANTGENILPELGLGEFLSTLEDKWALRIPANFNLYSAAVVFPKAGKIKPVVVFMDDGRMRQFISPTFNRPELMTAMEKRFEPGIKNSPAMHSLNFNQVENLKSSLRYISGFKDLDFDERGYLVLGDKIDGGSELARTLLQSALSSNNIFELESFDNSDFIIFGSFLSVTVQLQERGRVPFYRMQFDFSDFEELRGDERLRKSFNSGFVFLHELAHGVWGLEDENGGALGECESFINQIRRQLELPERVRYHYKIRGSFSGRQQGEISFIERGRFGRVTKKLVFDHKAVNSKK